MLTSFDPNEPYLNILSVPRDLWVTIPGIGEGRINTTHFFAEAELPGSGPAAMIEMIRSNFGVDFPYFIRIQFNGFREIVDALGGVDIELSEPMAGYQPGKYHLTGNKALAFVRERMDSDDFHRMQHGQFMIISVFKTMLKDKNWWRLPAVASEFFKIIETNVPTWMWPRLAFTLLRLGPNGIDHRVVSSDMVTPFTTSDGAMVLLPNWDFINPVLEEMFKK